ncbi:hypothetical protein VTJ04DRAFT_5093 [Mycothermus thermophilus]|uniref:uncharacterized protein n=1 Tax=Humicola insolens TaxID=85995 RepID=UPI00374327CE
MEWTLVFLIALVATFACWLSFDWTPTADTFINAGLLTALAVGLWHFNLLHNLLDIFIRRFNDISIHISRILNPPNPPSPPSKALPGTPKPPAPKPSSDGDDNSPTPPPSNPVPVPDPFTQPRPSPLTPSTVRICQTRGGVQSSPIRPRWPPEPDAQWPQVEVRPYQASSMFRPGAVPPWTVEGYVLDPADPLYFTNLARAAATPPRWDRAGSTSTSTSTGGRSSGSSSQWLPQQEEQNLHRRSLHNPYKIYPNTFTFIFLFFFFFFFLLLLLIIIINFPFPPPIPHPQTPNPPFLTLLLSSLQQPPTPLQLTFLLFTFSSLLLLPSRISTSLLTPLAPYYTPLRNLFLTTTFYTLTIFIILHLTWGGLTWTLWAGQQTGKEIHNFWIGTVVARWLWWAFAAWGGWVTMVLFAQRDWDAIDQGTVGVVVLWLAGGVYWVGDWLRGLVPDCQ